ncbi:MAG: glucose-1-phosphate cytidylyltransferase [bacterium]|nr:glucose-1-phosphate cytidylyltransferase [bacterium]
MKVVILCGGQGTRIRDVTSEIPKPMIPVGQYPILYHLMNYYSLFGHSDYVLCLGYLGQKVKEYFLNLGAFSQDVTLSLDQAGGKLTYHGDNPVHQWKVTMADTGVAAMTGARIKRIRKYVEGEEHFFLTYGDGLSDVDLDQLLAFHKSHGKAVTVTCVHPPARFGEMEFEEGGLVTAFNEKPQATAGWISGGFFVASQKVFDFLDDREDLVFEKGPMEELVRQGELMVYQHQGFWQCMDTARDHGLLNRMDQENHCPWKQRP